MGMSASQARFLSLTARKTNVEFEGQQINQQRTTLSNESANYYSELCNLTVPTPPSSEDFTKTTYTFVDGAETNTINTIIAQGKGLYTINYTQSYETEDVVSNGTIVATRKLVESYTNDPEQYEYYVGANRLRKMDSNTSVSDAKAYDPYLAELEDSEVEKILLLETQYLSMLREKYSGGADSDDDWMVRYVMNSATGAYEPVFYSLSQLENADYSSKSDSSLSGIKSYIYGQTVATKDIRNAKARVEQDLSGRYSKVFIYDTDTEGNIISEDKGTEYTLKATTESDDRAYNDAMNQYSYDKAKYDQEIQAINAKIAIIQEQDKDLELRLKQLDTEENAISTEMEAVKKVISKNVESSFKTFNA